MARQWTREELDRVHPEVKAAGWEWAAIIEPTIGDQRWCAVYYDGDGYELARVSVGADGFIVCDGDDIDADVAGAVILASEGLDSLGAMAAAVDAEASGSRCTCLDPTSVAWARLGREALKRVAAMLRRGTVKP